MELARTAVARLLNPFLTKPIRDVPNWWPMPFDEKKERSIDEMTKEEKERSFDDICRLGDKLLGNG